MKCHLLAVISFSLDAAESGISADNHHLGQEVGEGACAKPGSLNMLSGPHVIGGREPTLVTCPLTSTYTLTRTLK